MATQNDEQRPKSTGLQSHQEPTSSTQSSDRDDTASHGLSGEGSSSAMARLISQENSRIVPGAPEDAPNGPP